MKNKFYVALQGVKAEEKLKQDTYAFIQQKMDVKKKKKSTRLAVAFASFAIVLFAGLFYYQQYFTETAYIDIDVNPSMELTLNKFNRVIDVYAYNDDGQKVLDAVNIQHKTYEEALESLTHQMDQMGYIQDTSLFTASLQTTNGENETALLDALKSYIDTALHRGNETIFLVDSDTKICSRDENMTPAKYLAVLELQTYDSTVTFDNCRGNSVSEIEERIHGHMKGEQGNGLPGNGAHNNSNSNRKDNHHNTGINDSNSHRNGNSNVH